MSTPKKTIFLEKIKKNYGKLLVLLALLIIEGVLFATVSFQTKERVSRAFLIKNGNSYVIAWLNEKNENSEVVLPSLDAAIKYAKTELSLFPATTFQVELEHFWVQDRQGSYVLYWKTSQYNLLHHLTFNTLSDAKYFYEAFKTGAYSPSPYGHSLVLMPKFSIN